MQNSGGLRWRKRQEQAAQPPVVLLHGSGQDEDALLPFACAACSGHMIVTVRGRIVWEGGFAFFRRNADRSFDELDLAHGAGAVRHLLTDLRAEGYLPPILVGFSNGAIAAAAALLLDRTLSTGAILLRPASPRPSGRFPALDGYPLLLVAGADDERRHPADATMLQRQFDAAGARTTLVVLPTGHSLTTDDEHVVKTWLDQLWVRSPDGSTFTRRLERGQ